MAEGAEAHRRDEAVNTPDTKQDALPPEEQEMAALLMRNGWPKDEAEAEAKRALADAAEEDGYDGP